MNTGCLALIGVLGLLLLVIGGSFAVGIWIMMSGWGLSVSSWGVIIGGAVIQKVLFIGVSCLGGIIQRLLKD